MVYKYEKSIFVVIIERPVYSGNKIIAIETLEIIIKRPGRLMSR